MLYASVVLWFAKPARHLAPERAVIHWLRVPAMQLIQSSDCQCRIADHVAGRIWLTAGFPQTRSKSFFHRHADFQIGPHGFNSPGPASCRTQSPKLRRRITATRAPPGNWSTQSFLLCLKWWLIFEQNRQIVAIGRNPLALFAFQTLPSSSGRDPPCRPDKSNVE